MIRIAISQAAFETIARTLPFGTVSFENKITENGERLIWLESNVVDRLRALRGPGESYTDVILRVVAEGLMAEASGTWEGVERQVGAVRQRLRDKPEMDSNLLAQIRRASSGCWGRWLRMAGCGLSGPM